MHKKNDDDGVVIVVRSIGVHPVDDLTPNLLWRLWIKICTQISGSSIHRFCLWICSKDMPYAYIHEFTKPSIAGQIWHFKGPCTSLRQELSKYLPIEVATLRAEAQAIGHDSTSASVVKKNC